MKIMEEAAKIVSAVAVAIFLVTAGLVVSWNLFIFLYLDDVRLLE